MERAADARALGRIVSDAVQNAAHVSFYLGAEASFATETMCAAAPLGGDLLSPGMCEEDALEIFERALNCPAEKDLYDIKALGARAKLLNGGGFDAKLAAYVLNPQRPSFALDALCREADVAGFSVCPARALLSLCEKQRQALAQDGLTDIYRTVERPLADVLIDMEREGFLIDADALNRLGIEYRRSMERLEEEIYALAGERINLKSPKQLSELLFDRLGLPAPRKRSGGQVSTSAEVLEALAEEYPICRKILDYRKVQKLESTYVGALVKLRDENGRVHSSFDQVATATGRISSLEPNLQNIPVRTELGREIRAAFVARPGWRLVDADYSQIELRVLAHISGDERMRDAFLEGQDIHRRTAKEVYGVPLAEVTGAMRSAAKAVNFGIVYGISDFSLAKNIGVSRKEAQAFIERYFARYPGVKKYMDDAVRQGREHGYVTTLMGRRRYLPELASGNYNVRAFGERCAMNSPIQGTAADIIKLAMIRVHAALRDEGLRARLILQVHDELIVEAPEDEVERVCALVQSCMEGVMTLSVPLKTDISVGGNWRECK